MKNLLIIGEVNMLTIKTVSRNQGESAVGIAGYYSGEILYSHYAGCEIMGMYDAEEILYSQIFLPFNAPRKFFNRQTLWNVAEQSETRPDSRLAREVIFPLPQWLNKIDLIEFVSGFAYENFVRHGMCADVAIIANTIMGIRYAHVLLTTRVVSKDGFGRCKCRYWNKRDYIGLWNRNLQNLLTELSQRKTKSNSETIITNKQGGINYV